MRSELERMRTSILSDQPTASETRRLKLKELSDQKVKSWPNTLEAVRKKKESWKIVKLAEEENARIEIDRQEAELQKEKRLAAIQRANTIMYEQTERMKGLRSQQLYSDVIHERKAQVSDRIARNTLETDREKWYHEEMLIQIDRAEQRDAATREAQRTKAESIARSQREQLGEFRARHLGRLEAEKKDGELILKRALADLEEDRRISEQRYLKSRENMKETLLANERLKELRLEQQRAEQLAEGVRQSDVKRREFQAAERKRLEKQRFEARQQRKQKLIDRASDELLHRVNEDNVRLERQIEEMRKKEDDIENRKLETIRKQKEAIDISRREQLEAKERIADMESKEIQEMVAQWKVKNSEIEEEEASEAAERRRQNYSVKEGQKKQIENNSLRVIKDRDERLLYDQQVEAAMKADDQRFRDIVSDRIKKAELAGKPTYMLCKILHTEGTSLQPASGLKV